jgi:hemerythrin-like domain-containing protein
MSSEVQVAQRKKKNSDVSVIDLLLFDHQYLKECIAVLVNDSADKKKKKSVAKGFLDAVQKHSTAEKKAVYSKLESNEELHFIILEAEIEHGIIDQKVKKLKKDLTRFRVLKDETEAELKVLGELLQNHLMEEESEMFPKMQDAIEDAALNEMGADFMRMRKLSPEKLRDYPMLENELIQWKDSVQKMSSQFLSKMDKYVENLKH